MSASPKNPRDEAEARFTKKETAARNGAKAIAEYEVAAEATRKKTARLRLQRLAKEAAEKQAEPNAKNALPISKLNASNDV